VFRSADKFWGGRPLSPTFRAVAVLSWSGSTVNPHRRHLTKSQAAMVAARAEKLQARMRNEAKNRLKAAGESHGRGQKKVKDKCPEAIDTGQARDQAGAAVNVSGKSVDRATKVLKMMAHENMEEWGSTALATQETIRSVVLAYGDGKVKLPAVSKDAPRKVIRYAPSFSRRDVLPHAGERPYNAVSLGKFLGEKRDGVPQQRIHDALAALEEIERGTMTEKQFAGLGPTATEGPLKPKRKARRCVNQNCERSSAERSPS